MPDPERTPPSPWLAVQAARVLRRTGTWLQKTANDLDVPVTSAAPQSEPVAERPVEAEVTPYNPVPITIADGSLPPLPDRLEDLWLALIALVKSFFPKFLRRLIPDQIVGLILTSVLVLTSWSVISFILPPSLHGAKSPPKTPLPPLVTPTTLPSPAPIAVAPVLPAPPADADRVAPLNPDALRSGADDLPPSKSPSPQFVTPPNAELISDIQHQLTTATPRYATDLIQSVQVSFIDSRLRVQIGDRWQELSARQQTQLADDLWAQARSLKFAKLELIDPRAAQIARSPVVGDHMLILPRSPQAADLPAFGNS